MNRYLQKAEAILKAITTFAKNQNDETLIDNKSAFQLWSGNGLAVKAGEIYLFNDELYRVVQDHITQRDWAPDITPALYNMITIEKWKEWQPNNFYTKGAKVTHNGKKWVSNVDNNIWEPGATGVYTWDEWTE